MTALATTIGEAREAVRAARRRGQGIGFVPTMGALHAGHASLLGAARAETEFVVVSIFVNPTQFGPHEDFANYPRPLEQDLALCRQADVDLVFAPSAAEMYAPDAATSIHVKGLTETMCGRSRPGHFDGVCTVVAKLLNIVQPDVVYLGEKDAQQLAVLRRMARDLDIPVRVRGCPLVRDADGLALSSRNAYLSPEERQRALALGRALLEAEAAIRAGERKARRIAESVRRRLAEAPGVDLEYAVVADPDTLEPLGLIGGQALVAVAARVGKTRLIDNVLVRGLPG
jgi:pantoate--beta-alanine ligase